MKYYPIVFYKKDFIKDYPIFPYKCQKVHYYCTFYKRLWDILL